MGQVFIFTGGSCAGKNTVGRKIKGHIVDQGGKCFTIPSHVAGRSRRECDLHDEYQFDTVAQFDQWEEQGKLLWRVRRHGHQYAYLTEDILAVKTQDDEVIHIIYVVPEKEKIEILTQFLEINEIPFKVFFVFCQNEKEIVRRITLRGDKAEEISGRVQESLAAYPAALESGYPYIYMRNEIMLDLHLALKRVLQEVIQCV
jgi:guanylate kinase